MGSKFIIKIASLKDIHKVYTLRKNTIDNNEFDSVSYKSFWEWLFINNPKSLFYVLLGENKNEIIGQAGLYPVDFNLKGEKLTGGFLCELMVRSDFRKTLLFFNIENKIINTYKSKGFDFIYGLINKKKVLNAHLSFGFSEIGLIPVFVKPINLQSIFSKLISNRIINFLLKPFLIIIGLFFKNYYYKKTSNKILIEEINKFNSEINEVNSIMKELYNISPVKNKKVLNWRFVESPTKNYDIYLVKKKSKILGYYVSRITKMKNYNVLAIVDLFIKNHEENVIQAILNHVQRIGCDLEVDFIACMMNPENPMITQFRKNIFIRTNETFSLIAHGLENSKQLFDKWLVTWFDHDVV